MLFAIKAKTKGKERNLVEKQIGEIIFPLQLFCTHYFVIFFSSLLTENDVLKL